MDFWSRTAAFTTVCLSVASHNVCALAMRNRLLPQEVQFSLLVSDGVMTYRYPHGHADRAKRGIRNPHFLDAAMLHDTLLAPLVSVASRAQVILLPVSYIYRTENMSAETFLGRLTAFVDALPQTHRYAIELQNAEYLVPHYFQCLRRRNVAHVLHTAPAMPSLLDQIQMPYVLTADHVVVRVDASGAPEWKPGVMEIVRRCVDEKKTLHVYIDTSVISNPTVLLEEMMCMLNEDLAQLSPIRRKAA